jgi:hypothetical protein
MELSVITPTFSEPVTVSEIKGILGYLGTDQDARIARLIKTSREWIEGRAALSCISKLYKAYFEKGDRDSEGWFELPVSPVLSTPEIIVAVSGVSSTFQQKGMNKIKIKPDSSFGTVRVGGSSTYYVEVTFQAGKPNETAFECIRRIACTMFLEPQDGAGENLKVSTSRLSYDTLRLIESIDQNTGF